MVNLYPQTWMRRRAKISGGPPPPPPWVPTDIGGCVLWLRSDLGVTHDGAPTYRVSSYIDQVSGYEFVQTTDAAKFVYFENQINSKPVLRSDGIDDYMECSSVALLNNFIGNDIPFSWFGVYKSISLADEYDANWSMTNADQQSTSTFNSQIVGGQYRYTRRGGGVYGLAAGGTPNTNWHYLILLFKGTTADLRVDGNLVINNVACDTDNIDLGVAALSCYLPPGGIPSSFANIDRAEDVFYNKALNSDEITLLESYAVGRYFP